MAPAYFGLSPRPGGVFAVWPGARRRECVFPGLSRRSLGFVGERDGDHASQVRGARCAPEGDCGLPADRFRQEGSFGTGAVRGDDARARGVVELADGSQGHACGHGGDGRLLEAGLARALRRLQADFGQCGPYPQRSGPQKRRQRCDLDRRSLGARVGARELRAATTHSGIARPDAHAP